MLKYKAAVIKTNRPKAFWEKIQPTDQGTREGGDCSLGNIHIHKK